jgi:hypothetical protein
MDSRRWGSDEAGPSVQMIFVRGIWHQEAGGSLIIEANNLIPRRPLIPLRGSLQETGFLLDNADGLAGLALVVEMLSRWLASEAVEDWLQGQDAHLADRTPAYLIRIGRVADVIGALEAEKAGVYA